MDPQDNASQEPQDTVIDDTPVVGDPAWDIAEDDAFEPAEPAEPESSDAEPGEPPEPEPTPTWDDAPDSVKNHFAERLQGIEAANITLTAKLEAATKDAEEKKDLFLAAMDKMQQGDQPARPEPETVPDIRDIDYNDPGALGAWVDKKIEHGVEQRVQARLQDISESIPKQEDFERLTDEKLQKFRAETTQKNYERQFADFAANNPDWRDVEQEMSTIVKMHDDAGSVIPYEDAYEEAKLWRDARQDKVSSRKAAQTPDISGGHSARQMKQPVKCTTIEEAAALAVKQLAAR